MYHNSRPLTAIVVGAGHRAVVLSNYALDHPTELKIVGVAEPREYRRKQLAKAHGIPNDMCFETSDELVQRPQLADAIINATMDHLHVPTTIPLLKAGYHVLLEKPISMYESEVRELFDVANDTGRTVMICHELRFAPFYAAIRRTILDGVIGDVIDIRTSENVSYHHIGAAYIRGKWNKKSLGNYSMLIAKCCHDMDLLTWMKAGIRPKSVASFGGIVQFKAQNAPSGSGLRCLVDCDIENACPYSAYKNYIEMDLWGPYAWDSIEHMSPTREQKIESLKTDNPYGKCVWHCDNDVVDHQSLAIEFEDGCTATHSMAGGVSRPCRQMHIIGTKGEIQGVLEDGRFVIRHPDARSGHEYSEEWMDLSVNMDMHGGGDHRLVEDFVTVIRGGQPSISSTVLEDSINGHLLGFAADRSMDDHRVVDIEY